MGGGELVLMDLVPCMFDVLSVSSGYLAVKMGVTLLINGVKHLLG